MAETAQRHGLIAAFDSADALVRAARQAREAGYRHIDAYSPFPVDGVAEALGLKADRLPYFVLAGAILGGLFGYLLQYWTAVVDYQFNSGGKPLHSWPAFLVVTFELAILGGAFGALAGFLGLNRLPQLYHPVFNAPRFQLASRDRFFLCIEASDPHFQPAETRAFLQRLQPLEIAEVEP